MPPRWGQVREFCRKNGYQETQTDHVHYLKRLADGSTSGTMISNGRDGDEVPPQMWTRVWRRQLRLAAEDDFWRGLRGEQVAYALPSVEESSQPLPAYLQRFLRDVLHQSAEQIATTSREQAQEQLNTYYARELDPPGA